MNKVMEYNDCIIYSVRGHYEARNKRGEFICSGDNIKEIQDDLNSLLNESEKKGDNNAY